MRLLLFFVLFVFANAEINYILNLISKIENRKYNFINFKVNKTISKKIFTAPLIRRNSKFNIEIRAIFNNQVLINNKWYKIGDSYNGYKIIKITSKYVLFKKDKLYKITIKPKIGL